MTHDEVLRFIETHEWTFAKTMPQFPHEYTLRRRATSDDAFKEFVLHVRQAGTPRQFNGRTYVYLDVDGHTYWTMGSPLSDTILINRARLEPE